jgi:hypothetical protein
VKRREAGRNAGIALATLAASAACDPQRTSATTASDAASLASASSASPDAGMAADDTASASTEASAHAAQWRGALTTAMHLPCRAIAVDGPVRMESEGDAGADAGPDRLDHNGEIPESVWLSLAPDARLVAKDPRTTRETTFLGPARVRPCVTHREESWIASGAFESAVGAGETPGAEEWVVTPLAVVRYMAAKLRVDVRPAETDVSVGSGDAFLWLADDAREPHAPRGADGSSGAAVDDEGWRRMTDASGGPLKIAPSSARSPADAAHGGIDRCASLTKRARELAGQLISATADSDGGVAKEQVKTRRIARAACAVAAMRVAALSPSPSREALSTALNAGSLDR